MERLIPLLTAFALAASLTACAGTPTASADVPAPSETAAASETTEPATTPPTEAARGKVPTDFDEWPSNTFIATGSNYMYDDAEHVTFRTYFPIEAGGKTAYRFYFSNTVDSTWERGRYAFAGKPGGAYTIESARIADGGMTPEDGLTSLTDVTFDGAAARDVAPGETFWSDPVTIDIPAGHSLVWEWTLTGTDIPCIRMTELAYSVAVTESGTVYNMDVPAPQLIGAQRQTRRLVCLGDSITQGAQTTPYANAFWVAQLSRALGAEWSVWDLGLGYARASDCVLGGDWLERAKTGDIVTVAFGTNDLAAGQYGKTVPCTATDIEGWLRTIVQALTDAGCTVILFNAPPFDYDAETEAVRVALNERIPVIAAETGAAYFDWASLLSSPDDPAVPRYGGHPNDEGCQVIADAFLEQFAALFG